MHQNFIILGNTLLLLAIMSIKSLRSRASLLLANLAFSDLLIVVACVPRYMLNVTHYPSNVPIALCKFGLFVLHLGPCLSAGLLFLVSVERFIAITNPLRSGEIFSQRLMVLFLLLVWIMSVLTNTPHIFLTNNSFALFACFGDGQSTSHSLIKYVYAMNFVVWYCVPLTTMILLYSKMALVILKSAESNSIARSCISSASSVIVNKERDSAISGPHPNLYNATKQWRSYDVTRNSSKLSTSSEAKFTVNSGYHLKVPSERKKCFVKTKSLSQMRDRSDNKVNLGQWKQSSRSISGAKTSVGHIPTIELTEAHEMATEKKSSVLKRSKFTSQRSFTSSLKITRLRSLNRRAWRSSRSLKDWTTIGSDGRLTVRRSSQSVYGLERVSEVSNELSDISMARNSVSSSSTQSKKAPKLGIIKQLYPSMTQGLSSLDVARHLSDISASKKASIKRKQYSIKRHKSCPKLTACSFPACSTEEKSKPPNKICTKIIPAEPISKPTTSNRCRISESSVTCDQNDTNTECLSVTTPNHNLRSMYSLNHSQDSSVIFTFRTISPAASSGGFSSQISADFSTDNVHTPSPTFDEILHLQGTRSRYIKNTNFPKKSIDVDGKRKPLRKQLTLSELMPLLPKRRKTNSLPLPQSALRAVKESQTFIDHISQRLKERKRAVHLLLAMVVCFGALVAPFHFYLLYVSWMNETNPCDTVQDIFQHISYILLFLNSCFEPIMYAFLSKKFRRAVARFFSRRSSTN